MLELLVLFEEEEDTPRAVSPVVPVDSQHARTTETEMCWILAFNELVSFTQSSSEYVSGSAVTSVKRFRIMKTKTYGEDNLQHQAPPTPLLMFHSDLGQRQQSLWDRPPRNSSQTSFPRRRPVESQKPSFGIADSFYFVLDWAR